MRKKNSNSKLLSLFRSKNLLLYIAISMLNNSRNLKQIIPPEVLYILKKEDLIKLISVFGGDSIYIPSATELKFFMQCAIAGYYKKSQNQSWEWIKNNMNLNDKELIKIKKEVQEWIKNSSKDELDIFKNFKETKGNIL